MSLFLRSSLAFGLCLLAPSSIFAAVKTYHLTIDESTVNLTGKTVKKITVNGQFPAPTLEFTEGDDAVIHVTNHLKKQDSSIHWHGLLLPGLMDGVPGFNGFQGIKPQQDFTYTFKVRQNGTYWYHAHSKGQEQDGLYGALIIHPKDSKNQPIHEQAQQDHVVMLSDFHEQSSQTIQNNLKKSAEYYQNKRETVADVWQQVKQNGIASTWADRKMWNQMRMLKTDLSDVTGYTFLVNGKTPEQNWGATFKQGEKVRLRFINAAAMSFFDVRIPNLKMTVIAADGQPVKPVNIDEFRIGAAETYDVIVEPQQAHYQIQAESIDRTGFALASLQNSDQAKQHHIEQPTARPRALLSMQDMGHGMQHDAHASHNTQQPELQHSTMKHITHETPHNIKIDHMPVAVNEPSTTVEGWDNASTPHGHKALQYSDLKSLDPQTDLREPTRELVIRLGGTMERYIWTINGKKFNEAEPLQVKHGERIRLKFINDSMMAHPMHLHGMFMQLENGQTASEIPNKHTIIVPPAKTVTALLTADELGEWAIHCHLLYHMSAGMMNKLVVAHVDETATHPIEQQAQGDAHAHH